MNLLGAKAKTRQDNFYVTFLHFFIWFLTKSNTVNYLRIRLVEGVKKWEDEKLVGGWKRFSFLSYVFGWRGRKVGG